MTTDKPTTYHVQVHTVSCAPGVWTGNAVAHNTPEAAVEAARSLFMRWTAVTEWRVIDSNGDVIDPGTMQPTTHTDEDGSDAEMRAEYRNTLALGKVTDGGVK